MNSRTRSLLKLNRSPDWEDPVVLILISADPEMLAETEVLHDRFLERLKQEEGNPVIKAGELERLEATMAGYYALARETSLRMMGEDIGEGRAARWT